MKMKLKTVKPMESGAATDRQDYDGWYLPAHAWIKQGPYLVAGELDDVIHVRYNKAKGQRVFQCPLNWEFAV
jgi:hypothetical protein